MELFVSFISWFIALQYYTIMGRKGIKVDAKISAAHAVY